MRRPTAQPGNELNLQQFYRELGMILYAVASADGRIQRAEVEALDDFVLKELVPLETAADAKNINKANFTRIEFESLAGEQIPLSAAFFSFVSYLRNNAQRLSAGHKDLIIRAIERVAFAYKSTNRKAQEFIDLIKEEINTL